METHPQLSILDEFKIAIDKLPPTIPEVKKEAEQLYAQLEADTNASEQQVHDAMVKIGKQVYPHRLAIKDLQAKYKIEDAGDVAAGHMDEYKELVAKWSEEQKKIKAKIAELRQLADKDAQWTETIMDKVNVIEEGWSVVEHDPDLYKIKKDIEYWKGKLGMEN